MSPADVLDYVAAAGARDFVEAVRPRLPKADEPV